MCIENAFIEALPYLASGIAFAVIAFMLHRMRRLEKILNRRYMRYMKLASIAISLILLLWGIIAYIAVYNAACL